MLVGPGSKDRDAKRGRASGGFARGYKLHVVWGDRPLPEAWSVTALNADEGTQAVGLLPQVPFGIGYLLADGGYEASPVYDAAAAVGYQLVCPPDAADTAEERGRETQRWDSPLHNTTCTSRHPRDMPWRESWRAAGSTPRTERSGSCGPIPWISPGRFCSC